MKAIILAGGKGTRLKPYTASFPKPLVPVGDKPIVEIVIEQLISYGITDIILAVGHLAELIIAYFTYGNKFENRIKYSRENEPLGTIGALTNVKNELNETFLVMNGDILSDINYQKLLEYHNKNHSIGTIALTKRSVDIDFGVANLNESNIIIDYLEKPIIYQYVSMGIYIFEPKIFEYIPLNKKLDLPDLVKNLIKNKETVKGFIHDGYWLDIGRPEDYEKACIDIKTYNGDS